MHAHTFFLLATFDAQLSLYSLLSVNEINSNEDLKGWEKQQKKIKKTNVSSGIPYRNAL
jgi:hypothetical protein